VIRAAKGTNDDDFIEDDATGGDAESVLEHPAVVIDGSGYYAALKTQASFSCCLWEQRKEAGNGGG
jgi:predicted nucleic acid-binding Zn ribbon protein